MAVTLMLTGCSAELNGPTSSPTGSAKGLTLETNSITSTASFFPYSVSGVKMEVLAVRASDGTIRTAFNTCQVCYSSGYGYYVQEGNVLVCQNCGNRFKIDQIEKEKNGCNPVPILESDKQVDGENITIPADYLSQNKNLFLKWKT